MERGFKSKCENMSLQIRNELNLKKRDPLSPQSLASHLNVELLKPVDIPGLSPSEIQQLLGKGQDSWSAVTIAFTGVELIIYNSTHHESRQSNDIMHELSHIILNHKPIEMLLLSQSTDIVLREYDNNMEEEANWLAGCLLLPRDVLIHIKFTNIDVSEACKTYRVSDDLLTYRMRITGINNIGTRNHKI
jgi:hypothetical protein